MKPKLLVIGEALIDAVRTTAGDVTEFPGGSPVNVAVALGRLGQKVRLHTLIGDDARGRIIRAHVEESNVELTPTSTRSGFSTSVAQATIDETGQAAYEFDISWDPAPVPSGGAVDAVHTGSISCVLEPGYAAVLAGLTELRERATISYDLNARPTLMGEPADMRERMEQFVALADIVKASDEDIGWLYPELDATGVLDRWLGLGAAVAIVSRGGEGSLVRTSSESLTVPPRRVEAVDTVGAGDTFTAGTLDALAAESLLGVARRDALRAVDADTLRRVLTHASMCASITVSRAGANPPWRTELGGA